MFWIANAFHTVILIPQVKGRKATKFSFLRIHHSLITPNLQFLHFNVIFFLLLNLILFLFRNTHNTLGRHISQCLILEHMFCLSHRQPDYFFSYIFLCLYTWFLTKSIQFDVVIMQQVLLYLNIYKSPCALWFFKNILFVYILLWEQHNKYLIQF